jgi:HSP20 family protein
MNEALNRLFSDNVLGMSELAARGRELAVNVKETKESYIVMAHMPGVDADDVEISIRDGILSIKGETKKEEIRKDEEGNIICQECYEGSYYRQLQLPGAVKTDQAKAESENGILTITVPKLQKTEPKKIAVKKIEKKAVAAPKKVAKKAKK